MSLSLLFIPYGLVIIIFALFSGAALYHIFRFEVVSTFTVTLMSVFVILTIIIFGVTAFALRSVSWNEPISLFEIHTPVETSQNFF